MGSAKKRILLIEDKAVIRRALAELFTIEGFETDEAENGMEALRLLVDAQLPDLILIDLMMPIMDGIEFRKEQLRDPRLARIPTILLSASDEVLGKQMEVSFDDYIRKPPNVTRMLETISTRLSNH
jgi:CheY-like chemotaxis protein